MSSRFSSALNYLSGGGASEGGSRFVGQTVDLGGGKKLKVKKVIAEGGYGYVFVAQDALTGKDYALKRQVVSKEDIKVVKKEIAFLKQLGHHPHIIEYVASAGIPPSQTSHGNAEFLIQTELCTGGRIEEVLKSSYLSPKQVLRVFYATCSAAAHMHSQQPPIIHRDLKAENLLLNSAGVIKLCDFGSATVEQLNPDSSWTSIQRGLAEDEIQRNTTPMYRSPEMVDLYSNKPVSEKSDIWALGCLLYLLCYRTHPFEDSGKLRIMNANFKIPEEDKKFSLFHDIIRMCLVIDPAQRPSVDAILAQLYSISDRLGEDPEQPSADLLSSSGREVIEGSQDVESQDSGTSAMSSALHSTSQQAQKFFGFMKDGAGSLFKNIKESSSKALNAMAQASPKRSLDITYITSRILAMSYPHDDAFHGHPISEVKSFLDERHPSAYLIFNLSGNGYDVSKLNNQVYDFPWPQKGVPEMEKLVDLCRSMDAWLRADRQNVIVVHCHDGLSITPVAIVSYLLFIRALTMPSVGLKFVAIKRRPESPKVAGTPSQIRYLQYMASLIGQNPPYKPHAHKLTLNMLKLTTVPLFNAIRTGCKPFVEVFEGDERVFTSASHDSMDSIRSFHADDGMVEVPMGVTVQGNITIIIHHIRAIPVARKAGVGMTAVKMFFLHLHTGFLNSDSPTLKFDRKGLDGHSVRKPEKFPSPFQVILEVEWDKSEEGVYHKASWQNLPYPKASPLSCFSTTTEQEEVFKQLDPKKANLLSRKLPEIPTTPTTPPARTIVPHLNLNSTSSTDEESSSPGGGTLLNFGDTPPTSHRAPNGGVATTSNGHDFFSQLNWQEDRRRNAESAGYVQFEDQVPEDNESASGSSSGSSSSSSDDEFNAFQSGGLFGSSTKSGLQFGKGGRGSGQGDLLFANVSSFGENSAPRSDSSSQKKEKNHERMPNAPQIKLIEFGADSNEQGLPPSSSTPASYVDPFQQNSSTTTTKQASYMDPFQENHGTTTNTQTTMTPDVSGVVFDPWSGLSHPEEQKTSSNSAMDDILGWSNADEQSEVRTAGSEAFVQNTSGDQFDPFGQSASSSNASSSQSGTKYVDPFEKIESSTKTTPTTTPNETTKKETDPFFMLGESPLLAPTSTVSATPSPSSSSSIAHHQNDPFGDLLAPSQSTIKPLSQSRKLSSPPLLAHPPPASMQNLSASFSGNFSLSHPDLTFGTQPASTTGWGHRMGMKGSGIGTGSASHNTSPLRSPSPNPLSQPMSKSGGWAPGMGMGMKGSVSHNTSPRRTPSPPTCVPQYGSTGNLAKQQAPSYDPFGQFNLKQMAGTPNGVQSHAAATSKPVANSSKPPMGNSYQPLYMQSNSKSNSRTGLSHSGSQPQLNKNSTTGVKPKSRPTSAFQSQQTPNYNPSVFSSAGNKTGIPMKPKEDAFGDLLGSNFNPRKSNESRTLKDMKANAAIDNALDPDRARVAAWAEKKERNIRAILGSLHEILWEGETRWKEVGMHQLVQPDQVKKFYRKACLSVHPDKIEGHEHENLARAIFDELNDSYTKFEQSGAKALY